MTRQVFGMPWGFGGVTYGLTMRYLGLSLGMAVVLGLCTVFGTLIPPLFQGDFAAKLLDARSGNVILVGLLITLAGIVVVALAGARKDAALGGDQKAVVIAEFGFRKGIAVATFSGVMSACFAFGLAAGEPIKAISAEAGTGPLNGSGARAPTARVLPSRATSRCAPSPAPPGTSSSFFYTMGESQMGRFGSPAPPSRSAARCGNKPTGPVPLQD